MKKLILLFSVFTLVLMSCSSDDDSGSQDPLIGTWTYYKTFADGVEEPLTACDMQETFVFNSNGTVSYKYYEIIGGVCELEESASGTWTNDGNGIYTSILDGESTSQEITFDGNTHYFEYSEIVGTSDPVIIIYREVFIRN